MFKKKNERFAHLIKKRKETVMLIFNTLYKIPMLESIMQMSFIKILYKECYFIMEWPSITNVQDNIYDRKYYHWLRRKMVFMHVFFFYLDRCQFLISARGFPPLSVAKNKSHHFWKKNIIFKFKFQKSLFTLENNSKEHTWPPLLGGPALRLDIFSETNF